MLGLPVPPARHGGERHQRERQRQRQRRQKKKNKRRGWLGRPSYSASHAWISLGNYHLFYILSSLLAVRRLAGVLLATSDS